MTATVDLSAGGGWLDYGCGMGGLLQHLGRVGIVGAMGFERGAAVPALRARGLPVLGSDELGDRASTYSVVTMIEVIEHALNPVEELGRAASLLRPGGILFVRTGNARPFRQQLARWRYVIPDVHISFFEPETLARAMRAVGLSPEAGSYHPGWPSIYRSKLLHTLRVHRSRPWHELLPWNAAAAVLDRRLRLSEQPVGRR
ncbi:MAG: class I SAM-dependent methyltransferase [Acidimicrobiales bacterium]